ncbi:sensor histidine kinase [Trebonia sp.]|uniref:sensor histidine kinase n=1 Tax=Trebonia sp. TaxID=2767075 RepID=UPI00262E12FC|nr:sensor histidine kinase [Trebonia sp.]
MGPRRLTPIMSARYAPALAGGVLALAAVGQAIGQAITLGQGQPAQAVLYAMLLCLLALLCTVPLIFLRPVAAAAAITAASVLALAGFGELTAAGVIAEVIAVYRLAGGTDALTRSGDVERAQYLAMTLAAPFLVLALASHGSAAAVLLAALVPAAAGTGIAVRARRAARVQHAAAEVLAETLTEHTARGERARIARQLHDVVAHHISMIAVQAETARLTTPGLPAAGAQRFMQIGDTARAGLTEMRRLLGVLREDADATVADRHPQPGLPQLTELIDGARTASAASTRLIVSGPVTEFDPGVELAAYRIVQEALSNARRHAPGAAVDVEVRYADDTLRLRIRDNGPGPADAGDLPQSAAEGGHGLLGMRERVATVGGTLRTGAAPGGGFFVEAVLPAKPEVS